MFFFFVVFIFVCFCVGVGITSKEKTNELMTERMDDISDSFIFSFNI
jgi:hypothetical protein